MKRTFATTMPDRIGAFLTASRIFAKLNLNITRVSYNKAVDAHMLFLEAEGTQDALCQAADALEKIGYLHDTPTRASVIVLEFHLPDVPGAVEPILSLIHDFHFNISYISSQQNGSAFQDFRMGLFVEEPEDVSRFLQHASRLCHVHIVNYDPTTLSLDNTVFYVSFVNQVAACIGMSSDEKQALLIESNCIMEMLSHRDSPPYQTFDYIGQFAQKIKDSHHSAYQPRITRQTLAQGVEMTLLEPPCGSNICLLQTPQGIVCIDGGFTCFQNETLSFIRQAIPDFDKQKKIFLLTHADVDHCGIAACFDTVYLSDTCFENFAREHHRQDNLREENPLHAPYVRISKLLTGYKPPAMQTLRPIGRKKTEALLEHIATISIFSLQFDAYEGAGGHVKGETIWIERTLRLAFTGDLFVNLKAFTPQQASFNRLAPYLMTCVDTDPKLAAALRQEIFALLEPGTWQILGGHGGIYEYHA